MSLCFFCASHQTRLSVIRGAPYWFGHVCVPCVPSHWGPVNMRGAWPHQMSRWKEHNAICVRKAKTVMNTSFHGSLSSSELHWVKKVGSGGLIKLNICSFVLVEKNVVGIWSCEGAIWKDILSSFIVIYSVGPTAHSLWRLIWGALINPRNELQTALVSRDLVTFWSKRHQKLARLWLESEWNITTEICWKEPDVLNQIDPSFNLGIYWFAYHRISIFCECVIRSQYQYILYIFYVFLIIIPQINYFFFDSWSSLHCTRPVPKLLSKQYLQPHSMLHKGMSCD